MIPVGTSLKGFNLYFIVKEKHIVRLYSDGEMIQFAFLTNYSTWGMWSELEEVTFMEG